MKHFRRMLRAVVRDHQDRGPSRDDDEGRAGVEDGGEIKEFQRVDLALLQRH